MGNFFQIPSSIPQNLDVLRGSHSNSIVNICLLCHQDGMETARGIINTKRAIRRFLRDVYTNTSEFVFSWTTWDVTNADIVLSQSDVTRVLPVFDVIVSLACPFPLMENSHFQEMVRLLKPGGIAMYYSASTNWLEDFEQTAVYRLTSTSGHREGRSEQLSLPDGSQLTLLHVVEYHHNQNFAIFTKTM